MSCYSTLPFVTSVKRCNGGDKAARAKQEREKRRRKKKRTLMDRLQSAILPERTMFNTNKGSLLSIVRNKPLCNYTLGNTATRLASSKRPRHAQLVLDLKPCNHCIITANSAN